MSRAATALSLSDHYLRLKPDSSIDVLGGGTAFWESLYRGEQGSFHNEYLVTTATFSEDWPSWENHVNGDEIVLLLSGRAEFLLEQEAGTTSIVIETPGDYVFVPKNTWHTGKFSEATRMLFITAGEGTQVRPA